MNGPRTPALSAAAGIVALVAALFGAPVALARESNHPSPPAGAPALLSDLSDVRGGEAGDVPLATTSYRSWTLSAASHPTNSGLGYQYGGAGCLNLTGTSTPNGDFDVPLDGFTTGDVITFFRVFFYDNSPQNLTATLFQADAQGNYAIVAQVSSSGTPGYSSEVATPSWTVDNYAQGLFARLNLNSAGNNSLRVCRIRIGYEALLIFADGFENGTTSRWSATSP